MIQSSFLLSQCTVSISQIIPNNSSYTLPIQVSNLAQNDLSNGTQKVCGVRLKFSHPFIGNLQINLTSPAGQNIILVGFPSPGNNTAGTKWDIIFLPCANAVSPDAGFPNNWNNLNNWNIGSQYFGSYHPALGCLEDFNLGSANGIWQLEILNGIFYDGFLEEFELIFCDETGVQCFFCNPPMPRVQDTKISICEGKMLEDTLQVEYSPSFINNGVYEPLWVVTQNNLIKNFVINLSEINTIVGNYEIYALCVASTELLNLNNWLNQDINDLIDFSDNNKICLAISSQKLNLTVNPSYINLNQQIVKCQNEVITIHGQQIKVDGNYTFSLKSVNGCDSIIQLQVNSIIPTFLLPLQVLDCLNPVIEVDVTQFEISPPNTTILGAYWQNENGQTVSNSTKLTVTEGGEFTLHMTFQNNQTICSYDTTIYIAEGFELPASPVIVKDINCVGYGGWFSASSDSLTQRIEWINIQADSTLFQGDSVFYSWNTIGNYKVCAISVGLCKNSDTTCVQFIVLPPPTFELVGDTLTCLNDVTLQILSENVELTWHDENQIPLVQNTSGSLITATFPPNITEMTLFGHGKLNGCIYELLQKIKKINPPTFSIPEDTLLCLNQRLSFEIAPVEFIKSISFEYLDSNIVKPIESPLTTINLPTDSSYTLYFSHLESTIANCSYFFSDSFKVDIQPLQVLQFSEFSKFCNQDSTKNVSKYHINKALNPHNYFGNWDFSNVPNILTPSDSIDFQFVPNGNYMINFVSTENLPCQSQIYPIEIKVGGCLCLSAGLCDTTSQLLDACANQQAIKLDELILSPQSTGFWYITDEISPYQLLPLNEFLPSTFSPGNYLLKYVSNENWQNNCPDSVIKRINIKPKPEAGIDLDTFICELSLKKITLDSLAYPFLGDWTIVEPFQPGIIAAFNGNNSVLSLNNLNQGNYPFYNIVKGGINCNPDSSLVSIHLLPIPDVMINGDTVLGCSNQNVTLTLTYPTDGMDISWYDANGEISAFNGLSTVSLFDSSKISVVLENQLSGCKNKDSINIIKIASSLVNFKFNINRTSCEDSLFTITFEYVTGGNPPFLYQINQNEPSPYLQHHNIAPNNIQIAVIDRLGCKIDSNLVLTNLAPTASLGSDTTIFLGDSIFIEASINYNKPNELNFLWQWNNEFIPIKTLSYWLKPSENTTVTFTIKDTFGCEFEYHQKINIKEENFIFIPNIFSPNGDGKNDILSIPNNQEIKKIQSFNIYNRWGGNVYEAYNFAPNNQVGWDGTLQNVPLDSAVFAYNIQYEDQKGKIKTQIGTITLIR